MSRNYTEQVKKIKTVQDSKSVAAKKKHNRTKSKQATKQAIDKTRSLSRSIQNFATISSMSKKADFTLKSVACLQTISSTRNKSVIKGAFKGESPYKSTQELAFSPEGFNNRKSIKESVKESYCDSPMRKYGKFSLTFLRH